jgi:SAM-dependent methyltransferase
MLTTPSTPDRTGNSPNPRPANVTLRSLLRYLRLMSRGDRQAWKYLPYQVKMKCRRIDLGWVSVRDSGLSEERSHWHSNSGGPDLADLLRRLPICASDKLLDIGCGKAGAMLTLVQYPFARVDGVEISPNLARIARQNLKRLGVSNARVFCCDAAEFRELDDYNYFYMYNPFPESVLRCVMENISRSLERRPRKVTLIYKNPIFEAVMVDCGFTKSFETQQTHPNYPPFSVYVAEPFSASVRRSA